MPREQLRLPTGFTLGDGPHTVGNGTPTNPQLDELTTDAANRGQRRDETEPTSPRSPAHDQCRRAACCGVWSHLHPAGPIITLERRGHAVGNAGSTCPQRPTT